MTARHLNAANLIRENTRLQKRIMELEGESTTDVQCEKVVQCLQDLGDLGLTVSIVYEPVGCYSVAVMTASGETSTMPYRAESFHQAVWMAAKEALERNWI